VFALFGFFALESSIEMRRKWLKSSFCLSSTAHLIRVGGYCLMYSWRMEEGWKESKKDRVMVEIGFVPSCLMEPSMKLRACDICGSETLN